MRLSRPACAKAISVELSSQFLRRGTSRGWVRDRDSNLHGLNLIVRALCNPNFNFHLLGIVGNNGIYSLYNPYIVYSRIPYQPPAGGWDMIGVGGGCNHSPVLSFSLGNARSGLHANGLRRGGWGGGKWGWKMTARVGVVQSFPCPMSSYWRVF